MTEGMKQWMVMVTTNRGYIGCTLVARSIKVGQKPRRMRAIEWWRIHTAEGATMDNWWQQVQGNTEGPQRRLKQWLLKMLADWWKRLEMRHGGGAGTLDEGTAGAAGGSLYTPRMAYIRITLRKVLDSQIENCVGAWMQQMMLSWTSPMPRGEERRMEVEGEIGKRMCINENERGVGEEEQVHDGIKRDCTISGM